MTNLIGISDFAKRHTKDSNHSYYDGSDEELIELVTKHYLKNEIENGYRDGVILVNVPPNKFYSSIVKLDESSQLVSKMASRKPKEDSVIQTYVKNVSKSKAKSVQIVLYRSDVLNEDNDRSTDSNWEIISINASPYEKDVKIPIHPVTMMRNELHLTGGTKAEYDKEEYIESIKFWSQHANVE